jgi:hypothetical protein
MKKFTLLLAALLLTAPAVAGVVFEIEVTTHDQSPPLSESLKTSIEGRLLKMGVPAGGENDHVEMVYRGDRREMVWIDHDRKSYYVIDEETMNALAAQVNEAMAMMEQALANVPESQRSMVEEMMKKKMPQARAAERPKSELRNTGDRAEHAGYPCVRYEVLRGGRVVRELWVTDWSNVEGGAEAAELFLEMSDFFKQMLDNLPKFADQGGDETLEHMQELNGFPVVTREFDENGSLKIESSLQSANRQTLDPSTFEPPAGYKRQDMIKGR